MPITYWHITIGTYGDRLHGDERPTVDRTHNKFGTPFLQADPTRNQREQTLRLSAPVVLCDAEQRFIERAMSPICERGGWYLVTCAAGPNHFHCVLGIDAAVHGKEARKWLKRWLTQAMDTEFGKKPSGWWAEGGSNRALSNEEYFANAVAYVNAQSTASLRGARAYEQLNVSPWDFHSNAMRGVAEGDGGGGDDGGVMVGAMARAIGSSTGPARPGSRFAAYPINPPHRLITAEQQTPIQILHHIHRPRQHLIRRRPIRRRRRRDVR